MLLFIFSSLVCIVFSIFMYLRYAKRDIHIFSTICILLSWNIVFMLSILIPYNLYLAYYPTDEQLKELIKNILYAFYIIIQLMSIFVFPMLIEFEGAGEFTFKERLLTAFKRNIIFYSIGLASGLALFSYLLIKQEFHM